MIAVEVDDGVLTIVLDRAEKRNALTVAGMRAIVSALDRADADDDVRAVVVTGRGTAFCAGADLSAAEDAFAAERVAGAADPPADGEPPPGRDAGGVLALRIFASTKPVIAAVNGPAVGGGASMTLPMDVRLASTEARYAFPFVRRGITPEGCSSWFLPRIVGIAAAQEWIVTGRTIPAEEAYARGLVHRLCEPEDLLPSAYRLARHIADAAAPVSVALSRQMLWRMLGAAHPMEAHRVESRAVLSRGAAADAREGVRAFLDRRPPSFPNKISTDMPDFYPWWTDPGYS